MQADQQATALWAEDGGVAVVTLNRPAVRNAVDAAMARAVSGLLDRFENDAALSVCVITGAAATFCAGMDLKAFARGESARFGDDGFLGFTGRRLRKPVIAAVEGAALGGGLETALACDLVVCAENARLGLSEVRRGLIAAGGGLLALPRKVPLNLAMEMALTGEPIDGRRACEIGLANRATAPGEALAVAREMAGLIARNAPLAVAASKQILLDQQDWPRADARALQAPLADAIRRSQDAAEGARAFAEKRPPVWRGR